MNISVVVPCHNAERWIRQSLESLFTQKLMPSQVIVVDDSSTDGSVEQVLSCGFDIELLECQCGSAAAARNVGIRAATGDWVAFLDSDNYWFPDHLQRLAGVVGSAGVVAAFAWPSAESTFTENRGRSKGPLADDRTGLNHEDFLRIRGISGFGFPTTGMMISLQRLGEIGGFDERQRRRHDMDLFMRATFERTWSATASGTWWSRPPRDGDISSQPLPCSEFALRAMVRHSEKCDMKIMSRVVRKEARRFASQLVKHPRESTSEQWAFCLRYLSRVHRAAYRLRTTFFS